MSAVTTRTAVLWAPDWPVVAAMQREHVPVHVPAAVHDGRRLVAVSAAARTLGVRRGMSRRQAQGTCPELVLLPADEARDAALFETVAQAAEQVVPGIEVVRPGLLLVPADGASRFHGSADAFGAALVGAVARAGHECQVGIADGLLAALLAARQDAVVPPGGSAAFLAPFPVAALGQAVTEAATAGATARLVDLLVRLGIRTLGALAALPAPDVATRFGELGAWAHRLSRGEDPRPPVRRRPEPDVEAACDLDPPAARVDVVAFAGRRLAEELHAQLLARAATCSRLEVVAVTEHGEELRRTWRTDLGGPGALTATRITDRIRWQLEGWLDRAPRQAAAPGRESGDQPTGDPGPGAVVRLTVTAREVVPAGTEQSWLWGGTNGADRRAHRALDRVQGLLGAHGVLVATLQGGRDVRDQVHLAPWGARERAERPAAQPWPGRLPPPAPATVLPEPLPVAVLDAAHRPVTVDARWRLSAPPALLRRPGGDPAQARIVSWAGPWPLTQRWWAPDGRSVVHVQAVLEDGAVLLAWCPAGPRDGGQAGAGEGAGGTGQGTGGVGETAGGAGAAGAWLAGSWRCEARYD